MVSTRCVNRCVIRFLLMTTLLLVINNEFLIYHLNQRKWSQIDCKSQNCTRILLVADPQLLGKHSDNFLINGIAISDSDKYLKSTFNRAYDFSTPDVICYLGDLLDEGSSASYPDFKTYVKRFNAIFHNNVNAQTIHVPGDNDIGGENGEYVSNSNIRRFEIDFNHNDIYDYNDRVRFFKVNRMLLDYVNQDKENNKYRLRIGLSHMPLLNAGGPLLRNFIADVDPHIIFSAHWHESRIFTYPTGTSKYLLDNKIVKFDLNYIKNDHEYVEIMVPTSSYRMGTHRIGYGLAVIDDFNLYYTVLWSVNRFIFLITYVIWITFALLLFILLQVILRCSKRLNCKRHNHEKSLLIRP